jgi:hypothetical protein
MAMLQGKIWWAKVLKEPQPAYDPGKVEWSFDIQVDDKVRQVLGDLDLLDKIKTEKTPSDRGDYISFKRNGVKRDGEPAKPIEVVSTVKQGKSWQAWDPEVLIGNGSTVNVMFTINEGEYRGKPYRKLSPLKIQVVELVEIEPREEFPVDPDGFDDEDN